MAVTARLLREALASTQHEDNIEISDATLEASDTGSDANDRLNAETETHGLKEQSCSAEDEFDRIDTRDMARRIAEAMDPMLGGAYRSDRPTTDEVLHQQQRYGVYSDEVDTRPKVASSSSLSSSSNSRTEARHVAREDRLRDTQYYRRSGAPGPVYGDTYSDRREESRRVARSYERGRDIKFDKTPEASRDVSRRYGETEYDRRERYDRTTKEPRDVSRRYGETEYDRRKETRQLSYKEPPVPIDRYQRVETRKLTGETTRKEAPEPRPRSLENEYFERELETLRDELAKQVR
ncbi:MAG: hypothetical protein MHM6MM_007819 [Cercozoa sp. M6MM]